MIQISPSVLAGDFSQLADQVNAMHTAGADMIHLDVMDGHFVPNITFGAPIIKCLRPKTNIFFDAHLMISHPHKYLQDFAAAGCDMLTFHIESDSDTGECLDILDKLGVPAGLAIKPGTPVSLLEPYLDRLAMVLVMTVEPGFGGQKFMADMLPKLDTLCAIRRARGLSFDLQVDGGVDMTTAPLVAAHGANILVAGSALYSLSDYADGVTRLRAAAEAALS
jgi:ribulose-phosphate 3-epimerase